MFRNDGLFGDEEASRREISNRYSGRRARDKLRVCGWETDRERERRNPMRGRSSRSQTGNRDSGRGVSNRGVITFLEPEMQSGEMHVGSHVRYGGAKAVVAVRSLS